MRKLIYSQMVSLDGYVAGPNGELEWSEPTAELHQHFNDWTRTSIDLSINGRKLYQEMSMFWPEADNDPNASPQVIEYATLWRDQPKLVYSNTVDQVKWNAELRHDVDPNEINEIKKKSGGDIEIGGATLAAEFLRLGLIDEVRLYTHPVILGGGLPMFPGGWISGKNRLLETRVFDGDVVMKRYSLHIDP